MEKGKSLGELAKAKFRKDKAAVFGLLVIILAILMAILGPIITPDGSPNANRQIIELTAKKPGSTFTFLKIPRLVVEEVGFIDRLMNGKPEGFTWTPIHSYSFQNDSLTIEKFTGDTPNDGEIVSYPI
jgi:peptide/nickel transport system permease protein